MKVAAIQFKPVKGDVASAAAALAVLVEQAATQGAQLVVCPEMATSGYLFRDAQAARPHTETATGPGFQQLAEVARRHGCLVICGYAERTDAAPAVSGASAGAGASSTATGPLYNSARIIGPDGQLLYNYRKRLLFPPDMTWAQPGDQPYPVLQTPLGTLTAGICMDLNDDDFTAFLRQVQARIVAFCTNWVDESLDVRPYWRYRLTGVHSYFIAANTYGSEHESGHDPVQFCGASTILAPDGRTLARAAKQGDAILIADLPDLP